MNPNHADNLRHKGEQLGKAQRVNKFLQDICWTDDILPQLLKVRTKYDKLLIKRALGDSKPFGSDYMPTTEELAGRVSGIDFIMEFFEDCISKGDSAAEWLNKHNL